MFSSDVKVSAALGCRPSGRNDRGGEQNWRPEHKGISATSKDVRRKVVLGGRSGKPTQ